MYSAIIPAAMESALAVCMGAQEEDKDRLCEKFFKHFDGLMHVTKVVPMLMDLMMYEASFSLRGLFAPLRCFASCCRCCAVLLVLRRLRWGCCDTLAAGLPLHGNPLVLKKVADTRAAC